jgi:4-hydroxy-tetrahydrodipicolinate reductase
MGSAVAELVAAQLDLELVGGTEVFGHPRAGQPLGTGFVAADLKKVIDSADVVIEFTTPLASLELLGVAAAKAKPYVLGTTGFNPPQQQAIAKLARMLPLVMAPNFSVGVSVLDRLVETAAGLLGDDYDVEILELHHRRKKDAPSATALRLAETVTRATRRTRIVHGREGQIGEKPKDEIGVLSVRSGDIVGEHYVIFGSEGERLELVHKASSRLAFAQGAVKAARFVVGKPNGLYGMEDVLGRKPK